MREIKRSTRFKREFKLMNKRGKDISKLLAAITQLANDEELSPTFLDHPLSGNWKDFRECHIEPDWLLVYQKRDDETLELYELRIEATGTHSDLFG